MMVPRLPQFSFSISVPIASEQETHALHSQFTTQRSSLEAPRAHRRRQRWHRSCSSTPFTMKSTAMLATASSSKVSVTFSTTSGQSSQADNGAVSDASTHKSDAEKTKDGYPHKFLWLPPNSYPAQNRYPLLPRPPSTPQLLRR
jgi:hypothetical protein